MASCYGVVMCYNNPTLFVTVVKVGQSKNGH